MTKSEMDMFDTSFIGPGMLFLNQYFNTVLSEYIVLWMCFVSTRNVGSFCHDDIT